MTEHRCYVVWTSNTSTRLAAAFWTDCNWFTSPSEMHTEKQNCSSVGARRRTPGSMFYSHLQSSDNDRTACRRSWRSWYSRHFNRPQRREPTVTAGYILFRVLWNQVSRPISNGFRDIQRRMWRDGWHDLKRPLNKGHGHSFWYQSIPHIRLHRLSI